MGHDVRTDPLSVKEVINISPQETAIAEHLNARENLALISGLHGIDPTIAKARSAELLEMMGLADRASEKVKRFSGGMKRRLSIAMALVSEPKVLFLDEPTLGLDPQSRRAIWEHIESLKGTTTILHTTHYLEEADALADRIGIIDEGRIVALGTPDELKAGRSDGHVLVVESSNFSDAAVAALRQVYPDLSWTNGRIEIVGENLSIYDIGDILRPEGVTVESISRKRVTLDDVFLELTGKELRT